MGHKSYHCDDCSDGPFTLGGLSKHRNACKSRPRSSQKETSASASSTSLGNIAGSSASVPSKRPQLGKDIFALFRKKPRINHSDLGPGAEPAVLAMESPVSLF